MEQKEQGLIPTNQIERRQQQDGPIKKLRVGEWLKNLGFISEFQLSEALTLQMETGKKLGEILVAKGYVAAKELQEILNLQEVLSNKSTLADFSVDAAILAMVPESFARQHFVIPLVKVGRRLVVAVNRADDTKLLDHLSLLTGHFMVPLAFRKEDLEGALTTFYDSRHRSNSSAIERAIKSGTHESSQPQRQVQEIGTAGNADAPIIELVNAMLAEAVERGVSDIHLEPRETFMEVRFRIDGVLSKYLDVPKAIENSVTTRLKVLGNMNITEKRRPQDGRFGASFANGEKVDFRVSSISTHWGEKIVLRLLRQKSIALGMERLGFEEDHSKLINRLLHSPTGIILVTGPTGSGKTTTLYAALQKFDRETDSIVTIEDPVEYPVEGIAQIGINTKIDLTFAGALRTILRQDPDVIMLGEIRDHETLETATHAAMTGHLVLSTLHTNDAVSTVGRIVEMGIPPYIVSSTVMGVIAQRLVRRLCSNCTEEYEANAEDRAFLGVAPDRPLTLARGKGCEVCNMTGYKGQLGVYEILMMSRPLQAIVNRGGSSMELAEEAHKGGFRTMLFDAKRKIIRRMTNVPEVIRVLGYGGPDGY
jgi:type IV pilus assembly protein PilB